ncbi:MAG: sigma-54-dependent transcriptional regulator [bacterium]
MYKYRILIVDDEKIWRQYLLDKLKDQTYEIDLAKNCDEAFFKFEQERYSLLITDLYMPGKKGKGYYGLELVQSINEKNPDMPIIVFTGKGDIPKAVQAMKNGAYDFISKDDKKERIRQVVANALKVANLKNENRNMSKAIWGMYGFENFIGKSPQIEELRTLAKKVAKNKGIKTILIQGKTGVGKEVLKDCIHYNSERAGGPKIDINCAGLTKETAHTRLFGYVKGSFTDAHKDTPGAFEKAHTGTIFLDEVGKLNLEVQGELLRFLDNEKVSRHGGEEKSIEVDVRVIIAAKEDLWEMVEKGTFLEDLYFRLNTITLYIPPLRERKKDIPLLVNHFLEKLSKKMDKQKPKVSEEAKAWLCAQPWKGNVRELENCLTRAMCLSESQIITPKDLQLPGSPPTKTSNPLNINISHGGIHFQEILDQIIVDCITTALDRHRVM